MKKRIGGLSEVDIRRKCITDNVFRLMSDDWFLFTAGNMKKWNTMTAAWGTFGYLWNKCIAIGFIRPQRYTYRFVEKNKYFTFCFFEKKYRKALLFCGEHSGRYYDKAKEAGLTPMPTKLGNVYFKEANLVLECRKIYYQDLDPEKFLDRSISQLYHNNDYHRFYIGEIINCCARK